MYRQGLGVPNDPSKALKWVSLSVEQGLADSQFNLGLIYANGNGTAQDLVVGYMWVSLTASQGHEAATRRLPALASMIDASQTASAKEAAKTWGETHKR